MATAKKTAPAKPSASRALQPWEAEMAAAAKKQAAVEKPIGLFKRINISGGVLIIDEKPVPKNTMEIIVLAATHENQYFDKPFDPGTPAVPACYAFADLKAEDPEGEMKPDANSEDKQSESCSDCWANKMASATTGKGKACGNVRRMIVTTPDAIEGVTNLKEAEARQFKVPVMSTKNWSKYVHMLEEEIKRPYWGVVTRMWVEPDVKSQWQVKFEFVELITFDAKLYEGMKARVAAEEKNLFVPYPKLEDIPVALPKNGKGKPAAKSTGPAPKGPATRAKSKF